MTPSPAPIQQAHDARAVAIADVTNYINAANAALKSDYAQKVLVWIASGQGPGVTPGRSATPPVPPPSWIAAPHKDTPEESQWDAQYPGLPPMIEASQTGPPVAAQYVVPGTPAPAAPGTVVQVGNALGRDGEYACLPGDNMPAGYVTRAPDGTFVRKVTQSTPWGTAAWYQS